MISKSNEENQKKLADENQDLKECLKLLQREMFDIVSLKTDIFKRRFTAEYGVEREPDNEEVLKHEIEKVREELFNMSFDDNQGKDTIQKFRYNF